jgi:tape measure domain-containing protein
MNLLEFTVKLKDMASSQFAQLGNSGNSTFSKLSSSLNSFGAKLTGVGSSVNQLDKKLEQLTRTRNMSIDGSQIRRINGEIDALQKKKDRLTGGSSGSGMFGGFLRQGLALAGIGSMAFLGKDIMQAGMERQMNQTAFEVLAGKAAGFKLNNDLVKFAKESIYGNEVFGEGKIMLSSGVKSNNVMPIMNMIGDLAMGDAERMKSMALAFSETSTKGKLTGRQNMMFATSGLWNPLQALHDMSGKDTGVLEKEMEKGKISVNMLVKAMEFATGPMGRFHGMMQKMQDTPAGKWTAFTGTLSTLAGTIGSSLLPALGKVTGFLQTLVDNTPMLENMAWGIGAMSAAWLVYTGVVNGAAIATGAMEVLAYWPLAAVGVLAVAYADLQKFNNDFADSTTNAATIAEGSFGHVFTFWEKLKWAFQDLLYWIETAMLRFEILFEKIDQFSKVGKDGSLWDAIKSFGDPVAGSKKLAALQNEHKWDVINRESGPDQSKNPLAALGKFTPQGGGAAADALGDTTAGITGGGVRNITINVAKFQDKTEIHTANIKEGIQELEEMMKDMYLRITNSAASAMN